MSLVWARALARGLRGPRRPPQLPPRRQASGEEPPGRRRPDGDGDGDAKGPAAFGAALAALERGPGRRRRGVLEVVPAALSAMAACGVATRRDAYHRLLRLFPRGPLLPRGPLQRLLSPCPRHQECALRLLEQMESYGVAPDAETQFLLLAAFGPRSRPARKCQRMLYWLPRFRHADPHPLPAPLPAEPLALARLGLRRIAADPGARLAVYQMPPAAATPSSGERAVLPYIVGVQSAEQREQLARRDPARPLFVEGPFALWLRGTRLAYYVLRGEPRPPGRPEEPVDPERSFYFPLQLDLDLERGPWDDEDFDVDEVEEGPVFAMCMAGAGDQATLARWIAGLQETNPALGRTAVVFRLGTGAPGSPDAGGTAAVPGAAAAAAIPDSAVPDSAVPDSAVPDSAVPDSAVRAAAGPTTAVPTATAVPDSAVPDSAVPDSAVPDSAVPDSAVLDSAVPHSAIRAAAGPTAAVPTATAVPDSAVPDSAVPDSAVLDSAVLDSAVPDSAVLDSAVPHSAVPDSAIRAAAGPTTAVPTATAVPDSAVPDSAVPDSAVLDSAVPDSAVPDSAVPDSAVLDSAVPTTAVPDSAVPDSARPEAEIPDAEVPRSRRAQREG